MFCVILIAGETFDIFRSICGNTNGLAYRNAALFVWEIFSLIAAIASLVIIWKFPALILSERSMRQEVDWFARRNAQG